MSPSFKHIAGKPALSFTLLSMSSTITRCDASPASESGRRSWGSLKGLLLLQTEQTNLNRRAKKSAVQCGNAAALFYRRRGSRGIRTKPARFARAPVRARQLSALAHVGRQDWLLALVRVALAPVLRPFQTAAGMVRGGRESQHDAAAIPALLAL